MTEAPHAHDVSQLLANLRDHLARHDKPIAFFFGAGTSCAVRIPDPRNPNGTVPLVPDVAGLTSLCEQAVMRLGAPYADSWSRIWNQCKRVVQNPSVEHVLSRLHGMWDAVGTDETLAGLNQAQIGDLVGSVRKEIAQHVNVDPTCLPSAIPHRHFARWVIKTPRRVPIQIFTVNYDILIEHALESEFVPIFDGFVGSHQPFFHPDSLRHPDDAPGKAWTRLWKMHGSVTWHQVTHNGKPRTIRGAPDDSGAMILPSSRKYDESKQQPYAAIMDQLARFLEVDGALLVVCGFSFSDEHINDVIFRGIAARPRTHVYALQYEDPAEDTDLVKQSYRHPNIVVAGPTTAIIGGKRGAWTTSTNSSAGLGVNAPAVSGPTSCQTSDSTTDVNDRSERLRIGDFARFCQFLASMIAN